MNIFINTDKSPAQLQGKATGSPLSSFRVKRGASVPLSVTILGSDSAAGLRMGIKAKGNYEGNLLILAEADSGEQTEFGKRFDLKLVASSVELNDILDVGEGSATPPATIAAMTEFAWQEDGEPRLSDTLQTTILNDIIRLATEAPESTTELNPILECIQNGASVGAIMGIFLWREVKRAERYENLYNEERKLRHEAERKCSTCQFVCRANAEFLDRHSDRDGNSSST